MVGVPGVVEALGKKRAAIYRAIARGVTKGALLIQKSARTKIMNGPKSGKEYKRGRKVHRASKAGEAPANDLGNLARSIATVAASASERSTAQVVAGAEYAPWLENGTLDGKIAPRPFLTPSAEENAKAIGEMLESEITKAINS